MQKEELLILNLKNYPILDQLRLEEALLRADDRNWCIINEGSVPAIVMGISGKIHEHIDRDFHSKSPVPIIKRFSGGGTVFIDHNTCFITMICNQSALKVPCFPRPIMEWNADLYKHFLGKSFRLLDNDYVMGDRKFGGNAQYIQRNRWLHHSSILWDYDLTNMNYLLLPPRMPEYRAKRTHQDFLCRLSDYIKCKDDLFKNFIKQLSKHFTLSSKNIEEIHSIKNKNHRKSTEECRFF